MSERIQMITHWKVVNLINELENGNLRIPRFQRAYVWEPSKVVKLLNSMYKEYPIGTFFLALKILTEDIEGRFSPRL